MNRCLSCTYLIPHRWSALLLAAVVLLCLVAPVSAPAQTPSDNLQRHFPAQALRGVFRVTSMPPNILLNGKPERLAPGARIRDMANRIVLSGELVGLELLVNYTREQTGQVQDVWILTPAEAQQQRAGNSDPVIRNYRFASQP